MQNRVEKNFYVTLDSLVDVKLGLALYASPKLIKAKDKVIYDYLNRKRDNISYVPYEIIEDLYRYKLDESILKLSSPTPLLHNVIVYQIRELQDENSVRNEADILVNKLFINIYPYKLNEDTLAYIDILAKNILPEVEVEVIRMNIKEVTPKWILDNHIKAMYDYNGEKWICYHTYTGDLFNSGLGDVVLHIPRINNSSLPLQDVTDDFFKISESATSVIIPIMYLPSYFFSAFVKDFYTENLINEAKAIDDSNIKINTAKEEEIVNGDKRAEPVGGAKW